MPRQPRPISKRFWEKVVKTEECWEWQGAKCNDYGYFFVSKKVRPVHVPAHRWAYQEAYGPLTAGEVVDHRCHNRLCVRPDHLRAITNKQNIEHRKGANANSRSGIRGVTWNEKTQRWYAWVGQNGKSLYVGSYLTAEEASEAARLKRLEIFTHSDMDRSPLC